MFAVSRPESEVLDQLDRAVEGENEGSRWPGMSYEEGVANTLRWLLGDQDSAPMDED